MLKTVLIPLALGIYVVGVFWSTNGVTGPTATASIPREAAHPALEVQSLLLDVDRDLDLHLHGRVLDFQGKPLAGAELQLVQLKWRGHSLDIHRADFEASRETYTTNALGEFKLPLDPDKQYDLIASYGDLAPQEIISLYAGAFVEIVLHPTATFAGRVVADSDNAPIAGARVQGWNTFGRTELVFDGETDSDGRFRFEGLSPGSVRVQVIPTKHATPPWYTTELVSAETTSYEFRCSVGYRLFGKVTDAQTGAPIAGATVGQGPAFLKSAQTNIHGEYEILNFAEKGYRDEAFARAPGYGFEVQPVPTGSEQMELNFELQTSRRVTGQVFRPDGEGAADADVAAITAAVYREPDIFNWYPGQVQSDGSFVIEGLDWGGHYAIVVRSADFANVVYELPQRAKNVENFELSPIHLTPPATLRGVVRNETGEPLPGVWVRFGDHNRNQERFRYTDPPPDDRGQQTINENYTMCDARTDDLGRFTFTNLRPGPGFIDVLADGHYKGAARYISDILHVHRVELKQGQNLTGVVVVVPDGQD